MHFIEKSMKPTEEFSNVAGSYNEYGAQSCKKGPSTIVLCIFLYRCPSSKGNKEQ